MSADPTYDAQGRMNYHPDFHGNHKKPWTTTDQQHLVENYDKQGPEQVSLALERTIGTIMTRVYEMRKEGLMQKPVKRTNTKRILHQEIT